ncbi:hypothetical protein K439DRAFT_1318061, partial [Ramaria rubella]
YIVMRYIEGKTLDNVWSDTSVTKRMDILYQLKEYMSQIRNIGSTTTISPCIGPWFPQMGIDNLKNSHDITQWLNKVRLACKSWNMGEVQFKGGSNLVLTHQDIHMKNLLVDNNFKLWILDWEFAGYYPHYFE